MNKSFVLLFLGIEIIGLILILWDITRILIDIKERFEFVKGHWSKDLSIIGMILISFSLVAKGKLKLRIEIDKKYKNDWISLTVEFFSKSIFVFVGAIIINVFLTPWFLSWTRDFLIYSISLMVFIFLVCKDLERLSEELKKS